MAYSADTFVADEQPTTAKWNKLWSNDASFNDGTGIGDDTIDSRHYIAGSIDPEHLASTVWGWEELGRTTLGSAADTITVSSLSAKKYLRIMCQLIASGAIDSALQFNGDTGANYAWRISTNGGADSTGTGSTFVPGQTSATANQFLIFEATNVSAQAKQVWGEVENDGASGAGTAPVRREVWAKWHNTSSQISSVSCFNSAGGSFDTGSEVIVLGHN